MSPFVSRSSSPSCISLRLTAILFAIFTILTPSNAFLDYTNERMMDCSQPVSDHDRLNKFGLHQIDRYMFLILCPISIASTLYVIVTFLKYPKSRKQPSDLLFCISISDLTLNIHWFMQSIYSVLNSGWPPEDGDVFCEINSFLSLFSGFAQFAYNLMICVFLITRIQNALRDFRLRKSLIHGTVILGSFIFYGYLYLTDRTQANLYGMCSSRVDNFSWIMGVVALFFYLLFSWFTIIYFKKYVPNIRQFKKQRNSFLNFYLHYVVALSISWTILVICYAIVGLNCSYEIDPTLNIFITLGNLIKLITPIVLSAIRYRDPTLQSCIKKNSEKQQLNLSGISLQHIPSSINHTPNSSGSMDTSLTEQFNLEHLDIETRASSGRLYSSWSHHLSFNLKIMRLQSILAGLSYEKALLKNHLDSLSTPKKEISIIYDEKSLESLEDVTKLPAGSLSVIHSMKMKVFFPKEFAALREKDSDQIDFKECLDFAKNIHMLEKLSVIGDGGRSGELLFLNHDGTLLMKTLQKHDVTSFVKIADQYFAYLNENSSSFISKIYGLYSFTRQDTKDVKTYLIFMRNLANVPKTMMLRRFDLKGSTFDREVLQKYRIESAQLPNHNNFDAYHAQHGNSVKARNNSGDKMCNRSWIDSYNQVAGQSKLSLDVSTITMKDIDFDKLERKIHVSAQDADFLRESLMKDSLFFKSNGLIDYSLLVFKIAVNRKDDQDKEAQSTTKQTESFKFVSAREPNVTYHIGIIDYLQLWNIDKLLEQKAKQALHADLHLNVSSQNPDLYSSRFIGNVVQRYL